MEETSTPPAAGAVSPPRRQRPGRKFRPGRAGCWKALRVEKPRSVRARRREKMEICFLRRHVRRRKHFSGRKCGICPPEADKSCARRTASCSKKWQSHFFDSLRSRCGIHSVTSLLIGYVSWLSSAWSGRTTHTPARNWIPRCRRPHRPRRCRRSDPGSPPGSAAPRCS